MPWVVKAGKHYVFFSKRHGQYRFTSDVGRSTFFACVEDANERIVVLRKFYPSRSFEAIESIKSNSVVSSSRPAENINVDCEKDHETFEARRMAICLLTWPMLRNGSPNPWYCKSLSENDRNGNRTFNAQARKTIDVMTEKVLRKEIVFGVTEDGDLNTPARTDHSYVGSRDNRLSGSKGIRASKTFETRERRGNRVLRKQLRAE